MSPLRVIDIVEGTAVDGPGLRTSVYFAGCDHHCPGCHNPHTWDFTAGHDMSVEELIEIIADAGFNVTFTGGDPAYQSRALIPLAREIKRMGYSIWMYTGFRLEELYDVPGAIELLEYIDCLVDGPFIIGQRDTSLRFRGSANQRIIDRNAFFEHKNSVD